MMSRIRSGLTVCLIILSLLHSVVNGFTTTPRVVRHVGLPPSVLYAGKSKGEDNVISDFCIATNTFWKGLVMKPVRDFVETRPATIRLVFLDCNELLFYVEVRYLTLKHISFVSDLTLQLSINLQLLRKYLVFRDLFG